MSDTVTHFSNPLRCEHRFVETTLLPMVLSMMLFVGACASSPGGTPEPTSPSAETAKTEPAPPPPAPDCSGGVVYDDGTVETGYGFVPQATHGVYVQRFESDAFPSRGLAEVCICWLKTRPEQDIEFEVVFYQDQNGIPAPEPFARVPATASEVPDSVEAAGRFYGVDVSGIQLPEGVVYIGAHWVPKDNNRLFICTDTSEESPETPVFYMDDRTPRWISVFDSKDPIFRKHRTILVRARE